MSTQRIRFVKGALLDREFAVGDVPALVGRSRGCDIRIPDESAFQDVSRNHLMLVNQGDVLLAVNMSARKTAVDGEDVPQNHKMALQAGMRVAMGTGVEFLVLGPDDGFVAASPAETQAAEKRATSSFTRPTVFAGAAPAADGIAQARTRIAAPAESAGTQTGDLAAPETGALEEGEPDAAMFIPEEEDWPENRPTGDSPNKAAAPAGTGAFQENGPSEVPGMPETGGTIAGVTVQVSPDELMSLIEANRKAKLVKSYRRVGIYIVGFIMIAVVYFIMRPHPETILTWPKGADGQYDDKNYIFKSVLGDDAVGVLCPNDSRIKIATSSNGVTVVETFVGRDRDVKLRMTFLCEKNGEFLHKTRDQLFAEKRRSLEEAGGWNFLAASPVGFLGPDNGIPYRDIQYLRSEKNARETTQWFGHLIFAVHGDCALTFTREIPAVEQWRGGTFLARETMLRFSNKIIDGHWEGRDDFREDPAETMLAEADGLLSLRSPLLWQEAEYLLQSVMIKSGGAGPHFDEALKRLEKLRGDQRIEFNRLKALANKERAFRKSSDDASPALDEALRVFSSPDDKRNGLLRKGRWK